MSRFVLDCSVTMAWCFEDEADACADAKLAELAAGTGLVPSLWPLEVANVLLVVERKRRLTEADSMRLLELLAQLPIEVTGTAGMARTVAVLGLGRAHGLSAYDAACLDLAMREAVPIATRGAVLSAAARRSYSR